MKDKVYYDPEWDRIVVVVHSDQFLYLSYDVYCFPKAFKSKLSEGWVCLGDL